MLTDPGDIVLDIFAGSNCTGYMAEKLGRRWMAFETNKEYLAASAIRFTQSIEEAKRVYNEFIKGNSSLRLVNLRGNTGTDVV